MCAIYHGTAPGSRTIVVSFGWTGGPPPAWRVAWVEASELATKRPLVHSVPPADLERHLGWLLRTPDFEGTVIPPVEFARACSNVRRGLAVAFISAFVVTALAMMGGSLLGQPWLNTVAPLLAILAGAAGWIGSRRQAPGRVLLAGDDEIDAAGLLDNAHRRALGERPRAVRAEHRRDAILDRVATVQQDYGALVSDIVYRIENSALFDSAVPATASYQTALIRFDDAVAADVPLQQLDDIAAEVEIAYAVARDHAETVGIAHLPATARPSAERAAKAARLAARASTEGERVASLQQVVKILDSLALYYLPTIDAETLAIEPPRGAG